MAAATSSTPPPSDAMMELLAPDGYYKYLQIPKIPKHAAAKSNSNSESNTTSNTTNNTNDEAVRKSYRKLSRKHHPDKPGGDADTFRLLKRAQTVLTTPKLREQYDILGIDLHEENLGNDSNSSSDSHGDDDNGPAEKDGSAQGIVHEIANMILTGIVQLGVRTLMMAGVSLVLVRWVYTVVPAILFLLYIATTLIRQVRQSAALMTYVDVLPPLLIATGIYCMYRGRLNSFSDNDAGDDDRNSTTWLFWWGETLVIGMFAYNSIPAFPKSMPLLAAVMAASSLVALALRGNVWNYVIVVGLEFALALFVALAFPIMEMILEAVINEKLQAVGDRVRAHHAHMQAYYEAKK